MAPGSLSSGGQGHIPRTPSPLNPLSAEAPPQRPKRNGHCRAAKHEQSPTQRLMRQKAAVAWKSISSENPAIRNHAQTIQDEIRAKPSTQIEDPYPALADMEYHRKAMTASQCHEGDLGVRQADMEKQAFVEGGYQGAMLLEMGHVSHITTRRLITTLGILCILGVLSIIRAVGGIQAWRT
ncbi:hypothetical protein F5Y13DRAFT_135851 [Hypoxylon sp. FL1857]|nr:hypothetical protein F5Y13DRAFT_135851 [Hypoxylon sp. FL1857]